MCPKLLQSPLILPPAYAAGLLSHPKRAGFNLYYMHAAACALETARPRLLAAVGWHSEGT